MLDFGDLLSLGDGLGVWRFMLCMIMAGLVFWGLCTLFPDVSTAFLAIVTFLPGVVTGIYWECAARSGKRYR